MIFSAIQPQIFKAYWIEGQMSHYSNYSFIQSKTKIVTSEFFCELLFLTAGGEKC